MRGLPISVVAAALSIVVVTYGLRLEQAFGNTAAQAAGLCGLSQPAFCDTFTSAYQGGGRTGQLDPSRWSVTRISQDVNIGQGVLNRFGPVTSLPICDKSIGAIVPGNDVRVCTPPATEGPYFDEVFNDGGQLMYNAFRPRQAFDFANRTGVITFDADAKTDGSHTWWLELWVTDQPAPAPTWINFAGTNANPRNGINIDFSGCNQPPQFGGPGNVAGVAAIRVANNYAINGSTPNKQCFTTGDGVRNHFEIHLSQSQVQVFASDAGGGNFRLVASQSVNLNFTRGYVQFEHVQYNAEKEGQSGEQHYEWANMGFDGPVLPTPRGYDIPDAGTSAGGGSVDLGYQIQGARSFVLHGVDVANATAALLNFNASSYTSGSQFSYRLNGGPLRAVAYPLPDNIGIWRTVSVPVVLSDLHAGDNTLELSAAQTMMVSNVDVTVNPASGSSLPTNTPVVSNTATNTPVVVKTATNTPVVVETATNTPVVQSTSTNTPVPTSTSSPSSIPPTPVPAVAPPPSFVQVNSTTPQSPQSTVRVAYNRAQAAGNANVVAIGWNDSTSHIVSVRDSAGNTYRVAAATARGRDLSQTIYYASNIAAAGAGANVLTVTLDRSVVYADVRVMEYKGLDRVNPFDVSASSWGSGSYASTASPATRWANELIVGAGMTGKVFTDSGNGFANRIITNPDADIVEDRMAATKGPYSATAPVTGDWVMQMASFKPASP